MLANTLIVALLASTSSALDVPQNVRDFYNQLKGKGQCDNKLATGFFNSEFENGDMSYCGDHLQDYGVVYLQGPGKFSNMDPDCDGVQGGPQDDGRCAGGIDMTQSRTSINRIIKSYNVGITDLNANEHSYVVFGNAGEKSGWKTFDPVTVGVEEASLMAVVCGDKMFYGIWGDVNGDDSPRPSVGEASISLATACYGKGINAGDGDGSSHNAADVLYIAFTGTDAVPGAKGAKWTAGNFNDFHASLVGLGNKLIQRIGGTGNGGGSGGGSGDTCSWTGHCEGAVCKTSDDCSGTLSCRDGKCFSCSWAGHCAGAVCKSADDCSDTLTCLNEVTLNDDYQEYANCSEVI